MNKKNLLNQVEKLVKCNGELYNKNSLLIKEIEEKNNQIKILSDEIESLKNIVNDIKNAGVDVAEKPENSTTDSNTYLNNNFFYISEQSKFNFVDDKVEFASQAIGRIVVKCSELCNGFLSKSLQNKKDLVNLALGRTEVFKSELLQAVSNCEDIKELQDIIINKERGVIEYFDLLEKQV